MTFFFMMHMTSRFALAWPLHLLIWAILLVGCGSKSPNQPNQTDTTQSSAAELEPAKYKLAGRFQGAQNDSIYLYDFMGVLVTPLRGTPLADDGTFSLEGQVPSAGVYFMGDRPNNVVQVLLGDDRKIELDYQPTRTPDPLRFEKGKTNTAFQEYFAEHQRFMNRLKDLNQQMQATFQEESREPIKFDSLQAIVHSIQDSVEDYQVALEEDGGVLALVVKAHRYKGFQTGLSPAGSEPEHFEKQFLASIDFENPLNGYNPFFYNKIQQYVTNLFLLRQYDPNTVHRIMEPLVQQTPYESKARKLILLASMMGAYQAAQKVPEAPDSYEHFAKRYVQEFPDDLLTPQLNTSLEQLAAQRAQQNGPIGQLAPNISLATPDGNTLALQDLRGQVVLLDFWASWCRPCRMENPNVVHVYNQFKDQGFTVFSVSLDEDKGRWLSAIRQDGLVWPNHVSDLKGWKSSAAATYQVTGIPYSVLIDREGKIIATNLRGQRLQQAVQEALNS